MNRREVLGFVLMVLLVAGGRLVRHALMTDPAGGWRDPGWLESVLPRPAEPAADTRPARAAPARPSTPLDPNTCPADSLVLLPGIGPAIAARIIDARREGLHFARARDLQEIRGIGPKLSARISPYLAFSEGDSAGTGSAGTATGASAAQTATGHIPSRLSGGDR